MLPASSTLAAPATREHRPLMEKEGEPWALTRPGHHVATTLLCENCAYAPGQIFPPIRLHYLIVGEFWIVTETRMPCRLLGARIT